MMIPVLVLAKHAAFDHCACLYRLVPLAPSVLPSFLPIVQVCRRASRDLFFQRVLASVIAMRNRWVAGAKCSFFFLSSLFSGGRKIGEMGLRGPGPRE